MWEQNFMAVLPEVVKIFQSQQQVNTINNREKYGRFVRVEAFCQTASAVTAAVTAPRFKRVGIQTSSSLSLD